MEFLVYLLASSVALAVDYSTYWALARLMDIDLPLAAVVGYAAGLVVAYLMLVRTVFREGWLRDRRHLEAILFAVSGVLGLALTYATVSVVVEVVGERWVLAKLAAVAVSFSGVFVFRKLVVFRR